MCITDWDLLALSKAGARGISIALPIQSFDCTLHMFKVDLTAGFANPAGAGKRYSLFRLQ